MIKKVSETTPIMASVINTHSNSTTDTYSCDYINGTTLYESTTGTTGDINLSDSVDNYSCIELMVGDNDNANTSFSSYKFIASKSQYKMFGQSISSSSFNIFTKTYTKGTNKLTASSGQLYFGSSGSVSNYEVFKVYKVVGYK